MCHAIRPEHIWPSHVSEVSVLVASSPGSIPSEIYNVHNIFQAKKVQQMPNV